MIDLLVVGGALERTARHGGSAALSAGILPTAPDVETLQAILPDRDLYCAGGHVGGLQGPRYVAGLMLGAVFGPRAVEAVMTDMEENFDGS
jgi:hypothetical protein